MHTLAGSVRRVACWLVAASAWSWTTVGLAGDRPVMQSAEQLAGAIDELIEQSWSQQKVAAAPVCDDAEFFRRLSLDLRGHIPRVLEVRDFLADPAPDKRHKVVQQWLASPDYVNHFANVWRAVLLAQSNPQDSAYLAWRLESWLHGQLRRNTPYDIMVRSIVTVELSERAGIDDVSGDATTPLAFYQANELKPESLAAATSRIFLGVNLDCAQCHNHPFADWKQEQFWQYAAFFAGVTRLRPDNALVPGDEATDRHTLKISGTERLVSARYLDGREPLWPADALPRPSLAQWLTSTENPYFARAAANRIWAHFFGRGLVDPLDALGGRTKPTHPELLDLLARSLIQHQFDLKFLLHGIAVSRTYQRTSAQSDVGQQDPRWFARMRVRGLSPEQVVDSLALATGVPMSSLSSANSEMADATSLRNQLLVKFTRLERPAETQTTIVQSLALMNGRAVADATTLDSSKTLRAVAEAPFFDTPERIEALFLATLSRLPQPAERERLVEYIERGKTAEERAAALADVFWMLLNSSEFICNH